jgi:uncharacterized protein YkwD
MSNRKLVPALAAAIAAFGATPASACQNADSTVAQAGPEAVAEATRCLVNQTRSASGLPALGVQGTLDQTANHYAADMVQRHYFSHTPPEGTSLEGKLEAYISPARRWLVGENLAYEGGDAATARRVVNDWMNSDTHRANVLSPDYREIGIGVANGTPTGAPGGTFASHFGMRELGAAPPRRLSTKRARRCGKGRVWKKGRRGGRCKKRRR